MGAVNDRFGWWGDWSAGDSGGESFQEWNLNKLVRKGGVLGATATTSFEHRGSQCLLTLTRSTSPPPLDQFPVRVCSFPLWSSNRLWMTGLNGKSFQEQNLNTRLKWWCEWALWIAGWGGESFGERSLNTKIRKRGVKEIQATHKNTTRTTPHTTTRRTTPLT